jgi:hypothetical protein
MLEKEGVAGRVDDSQGEVVHPERVDELVAEMRRGEGLGQRRLGELGTTGGTDVGKEVQEAAGDNQLGAGTMGHSGDPGMAGRTARSADLGTDPDDPGE